MAAVKQSLETPNHERDANFSKAMHGDSHSAGSGLRAMMSKSASTEANKAALHEYFKHWDGKPAEIETDNVREMRKAEYATLTRQYYNLVTDLYEYGWGQSFHFCRFSRREPFMQAIARHEHYLALKTEIREDMKVLDVGCGVGGPAREIAKFAGCRITGLNNNDYQIQRAMLYADKEGLSKQVDFIKGDFMQMAFPDNSFDAVYSIEATVHAPTLEGVYREVFRVLKPGGMFGLYEWLMLDKYDNENLHHRQIRLGIEIGSGISNMCHVSQALEAMKNAGFEILIHEDLSARPDLIPWWWPLSGNIEHVQTLSDMFSALRMTKTGRSIIHRILGVMETVRLAPAGTQKTADSLSSTAEALVAGAKEDLFTPMYLMVVRKPAV